VTHCIIQWARLGDLFQTRPLLARVRCREPSANILLFVDEIYRPLAATFPEPHRVVGIPLRHYWALSKSEPCLGTLFSEFRDALDNLHMETLDIVYVLNRSAAAIRFAEMLRPKEMRGFRGD